MSPRRHAWPAVVGSVAVCALLSGCFGSGGASPGAGHRTRHHRVQSSAPPDSTPTSSPTTPTTTTAPASVLRFSPRSGQKHLEDCEALHPGDDPAEFLFYPVYVKASAPVHIDTIATRNTQGVVDAGAWVATTGPTPQTGTIPWAQRSIVTGDPNVHWSQRIAATGATLAAGPTYNVFIKLQVDPTPGDSSVSGIVFTYHDADGAHVDTWVARTTFSMSC
jgi:hypothetical protein